jgi:hypothetical protein
MVFPNAGAVVIEDDVSRPMQRMLDMPMLARRIIMGGSAGHVCLQTGQEGGIRPWNPA